MGFLDGLGAALTQHEAGRLAARQAQQMADIQNISGQLLGQYSIGLASGTSNAAQSYVYDYSDWKQATTVAGGAGALTAKPKPGTYRRGKVREGDFLYSDSPLAWLEERVDEMRLVL